MGWAGLLVGGVGGSNGVGRCDCVEAQRSGGRVLQEQFPVCCGGVLVGVVRVAGGLRLGVRG